VQVGEVNRGKPTDQVRLPGKQFCVPLLYVRYQRGTARIRRPLLQQSIDISYPPGPQQQTRRTLLQLTNGTDKRRDTVLSHRPCSAYYADSANNGLTLSRNCCIRTFQFDVFLPPSGGVGRVARNFSLDSESPIKDQM